ncbi:MAG: hypothetical protein U0X87_16175, partial [Anaerolineales bacterium]
NPIQQNRDTKENLKCVSGVGSLYKMMSLRGGHLFFPTKQSPTYWETASAKTKSASRRHDCIENCLYGEVFVLL